MQAIKIDPGLGSSHSSSEVSRDPCRDMLRESAPSLRYRNA